MCALSRGIVVINLYAKQLFGMEVCMSGRLQRLRTKGRGCRSIDRERICL